jgi:8-oxo-dGTP diphosphatase/2-hydroxy-dATP diphosphatase
MDYALKLTTLCYIKEGDHLLLGMKKRGFGAGRWNGFGGKVGEGESVKDAARRELLEEAVVDAKELTEVGELDFYFPHNETNIKVHIFQVNLYHGEPAETEEMLPQWFLLDAIPYGEMWDGDRYWLPRLLENKTFTGRFTFDEEDRVIDWTPK